LPGSGGLPDRDRRRIQTAVLGSADSQDPLALPLEAIELQAFRRQYAGRTFWCGMWLGGCGRQLTTKLYVDRACHFAHHADTGPSRPPCARTARDVTSADHLYVKAAAESLLQAQHLPGDVVCSQPGAAPAGALVEVRLGDGTGLTIHMDEAVPPDWQGGLGAGRIVLGADVPVNRGILEQLPYVHRVRCDFHGTSRRVLIGTQTAHGTQWFHPEQCTLGAAGLVTPALSDLPAQPVVRPRTASRAPEQPARISEEVRRILRRLAVAHRGRDIAATRALLGECDDLLRRRTAQPVLQQARDAAEQALMEWGREAAANGRAGTYIIRTGQATARELAERKEAAAREEKERQDREKQHAALREVYLAELKPALQQKRFGDVRVLLRLISNLSAGTPPTRAQRNLMQTARERVYGEHKLGVLQDQVSRRKWITQNCPTCGANPGKDCFDNPPGVQQPIWRPGGHDERLLPVAAERKKNRERAQAAGSKGKPAATARRATPPTRRR
jgi:hypothetical protein